MHARKLSTSPQELGWADLRDRKGVMEGEIRTHLKVPELASFWIVTPEETLFAGFACHDLATLPQFGERLFLREWGAAWIGHRNHCGLQRMRVLKEVLEEAELTWRPFELMETHHLDARGDVFDGARLLPELGREVTSGFITFFTLQKLITSVNNQDAFQEGGMACVNKGSPKVCRK